MRSVWITLCCFLILGLRADAAQIGYPGPLLLRQVRVPILMYHYISDPPPGSDKYRVDLSVPPDKFAAQLHWLKDNGYQTIAPDDLYAALVGGRKLPDHPILLTFDDGYVDAYANAYPILQKYGFTGTFFLVTGFIDEGRPGFLNWDQVKEMSDAGMAMQNHSREHLDMRNRDHDWLVYQILGPEETIEAHTGIRPRFFCYPSGGFDDATIRELSAAGVVLAFTEIDGVYSYSDDPLRLPRVRIRNSTDLPTFIQLLNWDR
ncbi:MAG TPA: polysaccharide deacetylase family protein [Aggregatilineales bacterium]|nr:polysaccharide deacetylase family protein [Aggregatilineales bacterium]